MATKTATATKSALPAAPVALTNPERFRGDLELFMTSCLVAGENGIVVSPPGWGKTEVCYYSGVKAVGEGAHVYIELSPSTPPERIEGYDDPAGYLQAPFTHRRIYDGTPYDPNALLVHLDEFGRASDIVFDLLIHATKRVGGHGRKPVFVGTSNFLPKSARQEAILSRMALVFWYNPPSITREDTISIMDTDLSSISYDVPKAETFLQVQDSTPTEKSYNATVSFIASLVELLDGTKFRPDPRRLKEWQNVVFKVSSYYYGSNDWDTVHPNACKALEWAWPSTDAKIAQEWADVIKTTADPVGSTIDNVLLEAVNLFNSINGDNSKSRTDKMSELGIALANGQDALSNLNCDRGNEAMIYLTRVYQAAAKGERVVPQG